MINNHMKIFSHFLICILMSELFVSSLEADCSFGDSDGLKELGPRKRLKHESCGATGTKACREKLRRDRLNERFLELGSILEPGRPPKTDKAAILSDAVRMVTQLRSEAQKLKESNGDLQEKIKELKVRFGFSWLYKINLSFFLSLFEG